MARVDLLLIMVGGMNEVEEKKSMEMERAIKRAEKAGDKGHRVSSLLIVVSSKVVAKVSGCVLFAFGRLESKSNGIFLR